VPNTFLGFVAHPLSVVANIIREPWAPFHSRAMSEFSLRASGFIGGLPANLAISIIALLMSTGNRVQVAGVRSRA